MTRVGGLMASVAEKVKAGGPRLSVIPLDVVDVPVSLVASRDVEVVSGSRRGCRTHRGPRSGVHVSSRRPGFSAWQRPRGGSGDSAGRRARRLPLRRVAAARRRSCRACRWSWAERARRRQVPSRGTQWCRCFRGRGAVCSRGRLVLCPSPLGDEFVQHVCECLFDDLFRGCQILCVRARSI
jgi:hypothetical protein